MTRRPPLTPRLVGDFTLARATSRETLAFYYAEMAGFKTAETAEEIARAEELLRILVTGVPQSLRDATWAQARLMQSEAGL